MRVNRVKESYPIGNEFVTVEPGQFISSARRMAAAINCSREIVGDYLKILEHQGWISREEKGNLTLFTILKKDYLPFLPSTVKEKPEDHLQSNSSEKDTSLSTSLSTNSSTNPATYIYNNINKKNNNISPLLLREENLKFYEEIRKNNDFWDSASQLMELDVNSLKDKSEKFFHECLLKEDYKSSIQEVKEHLVNWLKKNFFKESKSNLTNKYQNKENGKNTNNNRRGTEADTPRYRDGTEPKF